MAAESPMVGSSEIRLSAEISSLEEWYEVEFDGERVFRWSKDTSRLRIERTSGKQFLILHVGSPDTGELRRVTFVGDSSHTVPIRPGWFRYSVPLDKILEKDGEVRLRTDTVFQPPGDPRRLGVMVSSAVLSEDEEEALYPYETEKYLVDGIELALRDFTGSTGTRNVVANLIKDDYRLRRIDFRPGDVVVEIGGHTGALSVYLAKKYPFLNIYAFEPVPPTYALLKKNIRANGVDNVFAYNVAVTHDRRELDIAVHLESNSAGATSCNENLGIVGHHKFKICSLTLDDIFESFLLESCKLLIVDCEGCEYEIFENSDCLDRVDYLGIEIHENDCIRSQGYSAGVLENLILKYFSEDKVASVYKRMHG